MPCFAVKGIFAFNGRIYLTLSFIIRFMHERLRIHAESIAFFGGGAREKAVSNLFFSLFF